MNIENEKSFEKKLARLEEIVSALEEGKISLEDSVELFEEGMKLSKECNKRLDTIEHRVSILIEENGNIREEKFDISGVE